MTSTIENIKKVSLIFFIVSGFFHLGSGIFIANDLYIKQAEIVNKLMDVPLIITGLIYGFSSLRLSLTSPENKHKILDILFFSIIILSLIAVIVINLLVPNITQ